MIADRHRRQRGSVLRGLLLGFGIVFLGSIVLAILVLANFERLTPYIASAITRSTGREFAVNGDVEAHLLSWRPRLRVEKITYANPSWSKEPRMLDIGRLQVGTSLRRLLRGHLVFTRVRIDDALMRLEERADGTNNWSATAAEAVEPEEPSDVPAIRRLRLNDTRIVYTSARAPEEATDVHFDRARGTLARRVRIVGEGRYQNQPASVKIEAGSIAALHDDDKPFPIDAELRAGATQASIQGQLIGALDAGGLDVKMRLKGDSLSRLYPLIGVVLPPSPPYEVSGKLEHEARVWRFSNFAGRMGDSDLSGTVTVDLEPGDDSEANDEKVRATAETSADKTETAENKTDDDNVGDDATAGRASAGARDDRKEEATLREQRRREPRPKMVAEFRSNRLDFDDLAGLVGAPAATGEGETANAEQKQQVARQATEGRLLPDQPVDVPRLYAMDIDARLVATRVNAPKHLPIDDLDLKIKLQDGKLQAVPAMFDVANGRVELWATLYSERDPLRTDVELRANGLSVARLLGPTPFTDETRGRINGDVKLAMTGSSLREMLGTADGRLRLAMADAQVSELLVELIGLDLMNAIGVALKGDDPDVIRCAAADLTAEDGNVRSKLAVIDTPRATLTIELALDLGTEKLSARLVPHPKDVSLLSLRQDLIVEGKLANLDYYPDPLKLGPVDDFMQKIDFLLAPIVGLLTPFDLDPKEKHDDSGCSAFLREQQAREPIAEAPRKDSKKTRRN